MAWERKIFEANRRYRVKKSFTRWSTFAAGEILTFQRDWYSPYDSSFVYEFVCDRDGTSRDWAQRDEEPVNSWRDNFEPLDD